MEQLALHIEETSQLYTPTEQDLQELGLNPLAPSRWGAPDQSIYWHGPGLEYGPTWTLGNWGTNIFPRSKEHLKQILLAFIPKTPSLCHE